MNVNIIELKNKQLIRSADLDAFFSEIDSESYPVIFMPAFGDTEHKLHQAGILASEGFEEKALSLIEDVQAFHADLVQQFLAQNPGPKNTLIAESCANKFSQIASRVATFLKYSGRQKNFTPGLSDAVTAAGEQISSYTVAQLGLTKSLMTHYIDARKLIKTNADYGDAQLNFTLTFQKAASLETVIKDGFIPVMGKSYGEAPDNTTTRLGPSQTRQSMDAIQAAFGGFQHE